MITSLDNGFRSEIIISNEKIDKAESIDYDVCLSYLLNSSRNSNELIDETKVVTDPFSLSDIFINSSFDLSNLKKHFDSDAWVSVLNLIEEKKRISTCRHCNLFCRSQCIDCDKCRNWFHFKCESVSSYIQNKLLNKESVRFKCQLCKKK